MAGEVLVDALPYIDVGYEEPGVKQAVKKLKKKYYHFIFKYKNVCICIKVFALVEEECRRYKPTKNYLEVFGPVNYHLFEVSLFLSYLEIKNVSH